MAASSSKTSATARRAASAFAFISASALFSEDCAEAGHGLDIRFGVDVLLLELSGVVVSPLPLSEEDGSSESSDLYT